MSSLLSFVPIPPLLSLFSSSTFPHPLWETSTDALLLEDSLICLFPMDSSPQPSLATRLPNDAALVHTQPSRTGSIAHPVAHLQSPNIKSTFLRLPLKSLNTDLALAMDWIHFALKPLGKRQLVIELGLKDARGLRGVVRTSTFTVSPQESNQREKGRRRLELTSLPPLPFADDLSSVILHPRSEGSLVTSSSSPPAHPPRTNKLNPHTLRDRLPLPLLPPRTIRFPRINARSATSPNSSERSNLELYQGLRQLPASEGLGEH